MKISHVNMFQFHMFSTREITHEIFTWVQNTFEKMCMENCPFRRASILRKTL